jgi:hypothetical protein
MSTEVATHVYASCVFSLQPRCWIAVCYSSALLLALAACAVHNVLGRRLFWASQHRGDHNAGGAGGSGHCLVYGSR